MICDYSGNENISWKPLWKNDSILKICKYVQNNEKVSQIRCKYSKFTNDKNRKVIRY